MIAPSRQGVLVFGPLDPRSSGRAVVTSYITGVLVGRSRCWAFDTTPSRFGQRWPAALKALRRTRELRQLVKLVLLLPMLRRSCTTAYVPVNADRGSAVTDLVSRILLRGTKASVFLHHHSFFYCTSPRRWLRRLTARYGERVVHVVGCGRMSAQAAVAQGADPSAMFEFSVAHLVDRAGPRGEPRTGPAREELTLGFMARLEPGKGLEHALMTVERLRARGIACRLLVAGRAASRKAEAEARLQVGRHDGCEFLGAVEGETAKADFFGRLDCYLFPSSYIHETLPASVLEAMRSGCPVYAADRGCVSSMLGGMADLGFVQPIEHYVDRAFEVIDPRRLEMARELVGAAWLEQVDRSERQTAQLVRQLVRS